ncbi:MAG TPA: hypothetical protein VHJ58_20865 [Vicinamibacterales bacterium]|jgi:hypothetical protein|nr:hypothetical protein [Vicinamibacterales bacterium]
MQLAQLREYRRRARLDCYALAPSRQPGVHVARLDADERKRILPALITAVTPQRLTLNGPVRATYADGHLFYVDSKRALIAQAFDVRRLQLIGDALRIAEEVENPAPACPRLTCPRLVWWHTAKYRYCLVTSAGPPGSIARPSRRVAFPRPQVISSPSSRFRSRHRRQRP